MAYTGVTIETTTSSTTLSSHCIPAYPQWNAATTYNADFYTDRQDSNDALSDVTITLVTPS